MQRPSIRGCLPAQGRGRGAGGGGRGAGALPRAHRRPAGGGRGGGGGRGRRGGRPLCAAALCWHVCAGKRRACGRVWVWVCAGGRGAGTRAWGCPPPHTRTPPTTRAHTLPAPAHTHACCKPTTTPLQVHTIVPHDQGAQLLLLGHRRIQQTHLVSGGVCEGGGVGEGGGGIRGALPRPAPQQLPCLLAPRPHDPTPLLPSTRHPCPHPPHTPCPAPVAPRWSVTRSRLACCTCATW